MVKSLKKIGLILAVLLCISAAVYAAAPAEHIVYREDLFPDLSLSGYAPAGDRPNSSGEEGDIFADLKNQILQGIVEDYEKGSADWFEVKNTSGVSFTVAEFYSIFYNTLYDYPEQTYFAKTGASVYSPANRTAYEPDEKFSIMPVFVADLDDDAYAAAVDDVVAEIFHPDMTDFEKVVAAHDWIATHTFYDPYIGHYDKKNPKDSMN